MFGIFLVASSMFFEESSLSIGKYEVSKHRESVYSMGFLQTVFVVAGFAGAALIRPSLFVFTLASLPTVVIRLVLEVTQAHATMKAVAIADRSTFSFLRILTLPLLLIVDLALGYRLGIIQIAGVGVIILVLALLFMNHGISKKGVGYVLFTAFNAVITISLYKYHITYFNSVIAEELIVVTAIFMYFFIMCTCVTKEPTFSLLRKKVFFFQSLANSAAAVLGSFAFLFAPASIIVSAKRSSKVLWSLLFGKRYFHEQHMALKISAFLLLMFGLLFLAI